jgi:hypothetical protein
LYTETRTDRFTALEDGFAGYTVYDSNHEKIGKVDDLFVDGNDRPEYIGVKMGFSGTHSTLIPFEMATVDDERKTIVLSTDKETAKSGPSFNDDREITPEFENEVYSYYGLQRPSTIEQSGTYAAHSAEQSTQTTGRIKEVGGTKDNVSDELDEAAGRGGRERRPQGGRPRGSGAAWLRGSQGECPGRVGRVPRASLAGIANPRNLGWGPKGLRPSSLPLFTGVRRSGIL